MKVQVIDYFDVWGNEDDGFDVNDLRRFGKFEVEAEWDDNAELLAWLKTISFIAEHATLDDLKIEWGDGSVELSEAKNGLPLGRVEWEVVYLGDVWSQYGCHMLPRSIRDQLWDEISRMAQMGHSARDIVGTIRSFIKANDEVES
jgi:hypothetical protein